MSENSRNRLPVDSGYFKMALAAVDVMRQQRTKEKGDGTYASIHETLGIITEEYYELIEAVQHNDHLAFRKELIDIAVACIFGIACQDAGTLDW